MVENTKTTKICGRCGDKKILADYHRNKVGILGRTVNCKECVKKDRWKGVPAGTELPSSKICNKCGSDKKLSEFTPAKRYKYGRNSVCRVCINSHRSEWYYENRDREMARDRKYKKSEVGKKSVKKTRDKYRRGIKIRLHASVSSQINRDCRNHIEGFEKVGSIFDYLPYTPAELMKHLEKNFIEGMSKENYGKWQIDHIIARINFQYTSLEDPLFLECWALENLQLLWAEDNASKNDRDWEEWKRTSPRGYLYSKVPSA